MKTLTTLLALAMLIPSLSLSQSENTTPYLTDSSRSLQFGIGTLTLHSFDGGMVSYRQHCSPTSALRFSFEVNGERWTEERNTTVYHGDTLMHRTNTRMTRIPRFVVNVRAQYQWYLPAENDLYLFAGLGPQAGYDEQNYSDDHSNTWSIGVAGSVGAEWFASRRISLHAEYFTSVQYQWTHSNGWNMYSNDASEYTETTRNTAALNAMNVLFGLSVYF